MNRFYCLSSNVQKDKIILNEDFSMHHIRDVLKLEPKEKLVIFDEKGTEYEAFVSEILLDKIILNVISKNIRVLKNNVMLTVACAIPKKCKIDDIIDKLTQLGVYRIIPLVTERVIVRFDKDKEDSRFIRWQRIALSASQQSQRNSLPIIDPITDINVLLPNLKDYDLKLIPTLCGERKDLGEVVINKGSKNVIVFIGPEGDFTKKEVALAVKSGFIPVSLGDLVFRVDTAAIAVASFIKLLNTK